MDLPLSSFLSHFFLLTAQGVNSQYRDAWLPYSTFVNRIIRIFSVVTGLIAETILTLFFICNAVQRAEHSWKAKRNGCSVHFQGSN